MTQDEITVLISKMHSITLTIAKILAVATLPFLHPGTVTIWLITVLPHIYEIVFVDISLRKVTPDAGTSRYRAVNHYRTDT